MSEAGTEAGEGTGTITLREFYKNFVPPRYVRGLVARLLESVPAKYSNGLDCVVLTNLSGAPRRHRLGKVTSRKRRVPQNQALGRYHYARAGSPAWIELYVDRIAAAVSLYPWMPLGRTACFSKVLFHEIGHHVHATVRPEFREKEDVADNWAKKLMANYIFSRYWFVPRPPWKILGRIMKDMAADF